VQRISLQFYVHHPDAKIPETITDDRCAKQFLGRVFFTLLHDKAGPGIDAAPTLNYSAHISGRGLVSVIFNRSSYPASPVFFSISFSRYFIRSLLHPDQYWFFTGQNIVVSRTRRTKFIIAIQGQAGTLPKGRELVMIGTDLITIRIFNSQIYLGMRDKCLCGHTVGALEAFNKFSEFDGGFAVMDDGEQVGISAVGGGEPWELV